MPDKNLGFSSKIGAEKFFKENKKDIKGVLSEKTRTLEGESLERKDVLELLEEITKDLVGRKKATLKNILEELKEKELKASDRNEIIKKIEEILTPDKDDKNSAALEERRRQIIAIRDAIAYEQAEKSN